MFVKIKFFTGTNRIQTRLQVLMQHNRPLLQAGGRLQTDGSHCRQGGLFRTNEPACEADDLDHVLGGLGEKGLFRPGVGGRLKETEDLTSPLR